MQLKDFLTEKRAVSPVIGVILMVAITVILAAVIGTFVLGLGDSIGDNAPSASYSWDQQPTETNPELYNVTVTHQSGQNIDYQSISVGGTYTSDGSIGADDWGDPVSSGDSMDVNTVVDFGEETGYASGDEVRIIWTASGGGSSSTLTTYTVS